MLTQPEIISQISKKIESDFKSDSSGHDWGHIYRVWKLATLIAHEENADTFIVELGGLLHDIADWKFHNGDETAGEKAARTILENYQLDDQIIYKVIEIINSVTFKGANVETPNTSLEAKIVQDADRLDAIGAIGIARTFAYGGFKGRPMYDPTIQPIKHDSFEAYKKSTSPTINHFFEKLLLLKDKMHTSSAKKMAESRHKYMEGFLEQFFSEWNK